MCHMRRDMALLGRTGGCGMSRVEVARWRLPVDIPAIMERITTQPLGWITDENGEVYQLASHGAHSEHDYSGDCAICKAGDPRALAVVINAILTAAATAEVDG